MTGLGLGLYEYTHAKFPRKITGINFASTVPASSLPTVGSVPSVVSTVRITEFLALDAAKITAASRPTQMTVVQRFKRPFFNTRKNGLTF